MSFRSVDKYGNIEFRNENGFLHREDGPAFEQPNGYKIWWLNGICHREDGPARIFPNGKVQYYLNGIIYTKEDWEEEIIKIKLKRIKDL